MTSIELGATLPAQGVLGTVVGGAATFGRYQLLEKLGEGAMGEVWKGFDPVLERWLALKVLKPGVTSVDVTAEARSTARLSHPNVVSVFDIGHHDGRAFIAMEFVDGETLAEWARGSHSLSDRWRMLRDVARGLTAIHDAGLVHRDFKPANVLVSRDGRPRVSDFGLSVLSNERATDVAGTPLYMAPELWAGQGASISSDVFAFAATCWEVLTGAAPWQASSVASLRDVQRASPRNRGPRRVPSPVLSAIATGLLSCDRRAPTVAALVRRIERALVAVRLAVIVPVVALLVAAGVVARVAQRERACLALGQVERLASKSQVEALGRSTEALRFFHEFATPWVRDRADVCRGTGRFEGFSSERLSAHVRCLEGQRERVAGAVTAVLRAPVGSAADQAALSVLADVTSPAPCDLGTVAPSDESSPASLEAGRLLALGEAEQALSLASSADGGVALALAKAAALTALGRDDEALRALDAAEVVAESLGDDRGRTRVVLERAALLTKTSEDVQVVDAALTRARTLTTRFGTEGDRRRLDFVAWDAAWEPVARRFDELTDADRQPFLDSAREAARVAAEAGRRTERVQALQRLFIAMATRQPPPMSRARWNEARAVRLELAQHTPNTALARFETEALWIDLLASNGEWREAERATRQLMASLSSDTSPRALRQTARLALTLADLSASCLDADARLTALERPPPSLASFRDVFAYVAVLQAWACHGPERARATAERLRHFHGVEVEELVGVDSELRWRLETELGLPVTNAASPDWSERRRQRFFLRQVTAALAQNELDSARVAFTRVDSAGIVSESWLPQSVEHVEAFVQYWSAHARLVGSAGATDALARVDAWLASSGAALPPRSEALLAMLRAEVHGSCEAVRRAVDLSRDLPSSPGVAARAARWATLRGCQPTRPTEAVGRSSADVD